MLAASWLCGLVAASFPAQLVVHLQQPPSPCKSQVLGFFGTLRIVPLVSRYTLKVRSI